MALPFEIQIGRIVRFLSKWASTKGSSPRVALGSEIVPVLPMWSGSENRFLDSWDRFAAGVALTASAANFNHYNIRNPKGSNTVIVLEKLVFATPVADSPILSHGPSTTDLVTAVVILNARWDARGRQNPTALLTTTQAAATDLSSTAAAYNVGINSATDFILDGIQEIPILPGDAVRMRSSVANQANQCMFWWRERALEESELT